MSPEPLEPRRLFAAGGYDPTFGVGGRVVREGTEVGFDRDLDVLPDGRILLTSHTVTRFTADGAVDPTFGVAGVLTPFHANALAVQPGDGKLVLVGSELTPGSARDYSAVVARYTADGQPDPTFGAGGVVRFDDLSSGGTNEFTGVLLQPDGKVVVTGSTGSYRSGFGGGGSFHQTDGYFIRRYNPDGSPDETFLAPARFVTDVAIQPDGKLLISGNADRFGVLRLLPDGRIDTEFGDNGVARLPDGRGYINAGNALLLRPNGDVLVTGHADNEKVVFARYRTDGSVARRPPIAPLHHARRAQGHFFHPLSNGGFLLSGTIKNGDLTQHVIARYGPAEKLDRSFGTRGIFPFDIQEGFPSRVVPVEQPGGAYVIAAGAYVGGVPREILVRYREDAARGGGGSPARPGLSATVTASKLDRPVFGGERGRATVTLANAGGSRAEGTMDITLLASADTTVDAGDHTLASLPAANVKLAAGRATRYRLDFGYPDLPDGHYHLLAVVKPGPSLPGQELLNHAAIGPVYQAAERTVNLSGTVREFPARMEPRRNVVNLRLHNTGNDDFAGPVALALYLTLDQEMDEFDVLLATATKRVRLPVGGSQEVSISFDELVGPERGHYFLWAHIGGGLAPNDDPADNDFFSSDEMLVR